MMKLNMTAVQCQAVNAWRHGRKTPLTKFVAIPVGLVNHIVFYDIVLCRFVDCQQASLLAPSSRYIHSVISQKTGILQNYFLDVSINLIQETASCCRETAYWTGDSMGCTACLEATRSRKQETACCCSQVIN